MQAEFPQALKDENLTAMIQALDGGADVNAADEFGRTALHVAAKGKSTEVIKLLLSRGADVNRQDKDGRTPLHLAYAYAIDLLLEAKADWKIVDKDGNSPLHTAAEMTGNREVYRLLKAGVPVNVKNAAGLTPLHFAALQGSRDAAAMLLDRKANVNARTTADYTYTWTYVDPSALGNERLVPKGSTPLSITLEEHRRNKWSAGNKFKDFADFLRLQGATEPPGRWRRWEWVVTAPLSIAMLVLLVWGIGHLDARMRKWSAMADKFATDKPPAGQIERNQDGVVGTVGLITLKHLLTASVSDEGLYIAMPSWLRAGHPPLLVPWNQVRVSEIGSGVDGPIVRFYIGHPRVGTVELRGGLAKAAQDRAQ